MQAKTKEERAHQILAWLRDNYPCGRPVYIRWRKKLPQDCAGFTWRDGDALEIFLSKNRNRTWVEANATLIHEYAHCIQWPLARVEDQPEHRHHPPSFYAQEGELISDWSLDGYEVSKAYSVKRVLRPGSPGRGRKARKRARARTRVR